MATPVAIPCCVPLAAKLHNMPILEQLGRSTIESCRTYFSAAAPRAESGQQTSPVSSTQLILLNQLGTLPSVARSWDSRTVETELRNIDATNTTELEITRSPTPTAVQQMLAKRYGISLSSCRKKASASLAAVMPPSIRSLAVLYGVLEYEGDVPRSNSGAKYLAEDLAQTRPHPHPLDVDVSPVAISQMNELFSRLGYIGRAPFSYSSAQLLAACLRTILADVDDEARLRPLPSMDSRQSELIQYLRSRRAPPGTRGLPAVLEVDLGARGGVSRLAAARNILQLVQNHELSVSPHGQPVEALRGLGHLGPVPPTTGEALMLAAELRDRCMAPSPEQMAALRAAGYGPGGPQPESVAHLKAVLRVLRRADTDASTPATRGALRHLSDLRQRPLAAPYAAAAAAAAGTGSWAAGSGGCGQRPGPCPSQLEVRAVIEDLPLSEHMMERLFDLGWAGPMPPTHGAALALEEYLQHHKTSSAAAHAPPSPLSTSSPHAACDPSSAPGSSPLSLSISMMSSGGPAGQFRRAHGGHSPFDPHPRQQHIISRMGASPEEVLTKIQIRGMFPGAVSEWYLPSMCREEAEHLLGCLRAARRVVLERAAGAGYDEYVEAWEASETEGDWWGMEWLWH